MRKRSKEERAAWDQVRLLYLKRVAGADLPDQVDDLGVDALALVQGARLPRDPLDPGSHSAAWAALEVAFDQAWGEANLPLLRGAV